MDSINSKLASQSLKYIVRNLMNQRSAIFKGEYTAQYQYLKDAFERLMIDVGRLNEELVDDLNEIIKDGVCHMAKSFGDGLPVHPSTMNILILATRVYNATPNAPFRVNDKVPCQNVTTNGLVFLSNVIMRVLKSFDSDPETPLFPLDYPPWQLPATRLPRPSRPSAHAAPMARNPRIFIIHAHGMLPVIQGEVDDPALPIFDNPVMGYPLASSGAAISSSSHRTNQVVKLESRVDTFTSAKFGKAIWLQVAEDPPQLILVNKLLGLFEEGALPKTKTACRQLIKRALCETRELVVAERDHDTCRFRCHRVGRKIADVTLFCDGAAFVEGIVRFDAETGDVQYVNEQFGLVDKRQLSRPVKEYEKFNKFSDDKIAFLAKRKLRAEQELAAMQANPVNFKGKTFRMRTLAEAIQNYDTTIRNMDRHSNYEFSDDVKERSGDKIRLSTLIDNGITGGIIDPKNDFVVVLSCRVPDGILPLGTSSPRSSSDSSLSEGGKRRTKSKPKPKPKPNPKRTRKHKQHN
jgi:hypothetical protein